MIKKIISAAVSAALASCMMPIIPSYADEKTAGGDVNGDGSFNVADAVMLSSFLLGDGELTSPDEADLVSDGRIDAFDLVAMRRLLINGSTDPFEKLIGMEYGEAVKNGYISRAEYNYQITGGLKSSIEEKMGRPVDVSIDRFYRVDTEALGISAEQGYLYNCETRQVYPITEETNMNCATWYWRGKRAAALDLDTDEERQEDFLDGLEYYGINEIYYCIGPKRLLANVEMVETFVKKAYARDMKVYLVAGENYWLGEDTYQEAIYSYFDNIAEYNSRVSYDGRIAGVSYDAEVWGNKELNWKTDISQRCQHIKFIQTAQDYADSKNLAVSFCLAYWLVKYDYIDDNGENRNVYDGITEIANETILMAYRDTPAAVEKLLLKVQTDAPDTVANINRKNGCNMEVAVELNSTDEGAHVSFFEEETAEPGCTRYAIAEMKEDMAEYSGFTSYALHHAEVMYEFYLEAMKKGSE